MKNHKFLRKFKLKLSTVWGTRRVPATEDQTETTCSGLQLPMEKKLALSDYRRAFDLKKILKLYEIHHPYDLRVSQDTMMASLCELKDNFVTILEFLDVIKVFEFKPRLREHYNTELRVNFVTSGQFIDDNKRKDRPTRIEDQAEAGCISIGLHLRSMIQGSCSVLGAKSLAEVLQHWVEHIDLYGTNTQHAAHLQIAFAELLYAGRFVENCLVALVGYEQFLERHCITALND